MIIDLSRPQVERILLLLEDTRDKVELALKNPTPKAKNPPTMYELAVAYMQLTEAQGALNSALRADAAEERAKK